MKNKIFSNRIFPKIIKVMSGALFIAVLASCSKDEDIGFPEDQYNNRMLGILNLMMKSMDSLTMSNDPDNDFAMMMRVQHRGAIAMGELEMAEGNDLALREVAGNMIERNKKDIITLDSFLIVHSPIVNEVRFRTEAETALGIMNKNAGLQKLNGNIDHDFALILLQHHLGSINLIDLLSQYGETERMKQFAGKIKNDQQKVIKELQDWLLE
jgi:uncharacterized protein (DUF305 family)